jgi:hypothetical protein
MSSDIHPGDCVQLPDGRIGRVREQAGNTYTVRVRRSTSKTHQFVRCSGAEIQRVECPKGWMSADGYNRYLEATLDKMRQRVSSGSASE